MVEEEKCLASIYLLLGQRYATKEREKKKEKTDHKVII